MSDAIRDDAHRESALGEALVELGVGRQRTVKATARPVKVVAPDGSVQVITHGELVKRLAEREGIASVLRDDGLAVLIAARRARGEPDPCEWCGVPMPMTKHCLVHRNKIPHPWVGAACGCAALKQKGFTSRPDGYAPKQWKKHISKPLLRKLRAEGRDPKSMAKQAREDAKAAAKAALRAKREALAAEIEAETKRRAERRAERLAMTKDALRAEALARWNAMSPERKAEIIEAGRRGGHLGWQATHLGKRDRQ